MKPLTLTVSSSFRDPRSALRVKAIRVDSCPFVVKKASFRGCATGIATVPQDLATTRTNLHQLARLASTCGENKLCRGEKYGVPPLGGRPDFLTPTNGNSRLLTPTNAQNILRGNGCPGPRIGKSSQVKVNQGKYRQLKPAKYVAPTVPNGRLRAVIVTKCRRSRNR